VRQEAAALTNAADLLDESVVQAARWTARCQASVIVTGVGKAGLVGQKLVATLASTGTPAHFLHPTEAIHGDFGRVQPGDLIWAFSNSGRSSEVVQIASQLRQQGSGLVTFTADANSPLAEVADCSIVFGKHAEACPRGLAPTSSTTVMMAVGDAVAMLASELRQFTADDFARFHPGGALGKKFCDVQQLMRPLTNCRMTHQSVTIRDCMALSSVTGRRSGAIMVVNDAGVLTGVFTDSDLARLLEARAESALDRPVCEQMAIDPHCVDPETLLSDAISLLSQLRISELPVVDAYRRPLGMLDITDLIAIGEVEPQQLWEYERATIPIRDSVPDSH
jgi:arabinose-5-phosphate isomerase